MAQENAPPWLKRMDNGAIGEARTKAFLMDRFWILERSVDIDGADFIIQRKIRAANLLDPRPPRLGVVQVKFFSDQATTHYIHKEYLLDKNGEPRSEFFVMCHTGAENDASVYLLSAKDIIDYFQEVREGLTQEGKFAIPGRSLLGEDRFKVVSSRVTLDRMDWAILQADFRNNRAFLSWALPSVDTDVQSIDPMYLEPLDNWWGDIPSGFIKMKERAKQALWDIEDVYQDYKKIVESSDPEEALSIAEDLEDSFRSCGRVSLSLPEDLFDVDFLSAVKQHKTKYQNLKTGGKLDAFLALREQIVKKIAVNLGPKMPLNRADACVFKITYDPATLKAVGFEIGQSKRSELSLPADSTAGGWDHRSDGVLASEPGSVQAYFVPAYFEHLKKTSISWTEHFLANKPYVLRDVMEEVYGHLFPKDQN